MFICKSAFDINDWNTWVAIGWYCIWLAGPLELSIGVTTDVVFTSGGGYGAIWLWFKYNGRPPLPPAEPGEPWAPVGPLQERPVAPCGPWDPVVPWYPTGPIDEGPIEPWAPCGPCPFKSQHFFEPKYWV